jgi:hypothetical protein
MTPASSSASRAADSCGDESLAKLPLGITQRPLSREVMRRMLTGASMVPPVER